MQYIGPVVICIFLLLHRWGPRIIRKVKNAVCSPHKSRRGCEWRTGCMSPVLADSGPCPNLPLQSGLWPVTAGIQGFAWSFYPLSSPLQLFVVLCILFIPCQLPCEMSVVLSLSDSVELQLWACWDGRRSESSAGQSTECSVSLQWLKIVFTL